MGKVLIALIMLSLFVTGCGDRTLLLQDERFINSMYNRADRPSYPGYSAIKVLQRKGEGTGSNPRILIIRVTLESYPADIICEGEFQYFRGDPAFARTDWYSLEGVIHKRIVGKARWYLTQTSGPQCQNKLVLLVLKRWVNEGLIELGNIADARVANSVVNLLENPIDLPEYFTDTGFLDLTRVQIQDLAPELPDKEKTLVYVLRSNGILESYLKGQSVEIREMINIDSCDFVLESPIPKP